MAWIKARYTELCLVSGENINFKNLWTSLKLINMEAPWTKKIEGVYVHFSVVFLLFC